jgi:hypothetical protein
MSVETLLRGNVMTALIMFAIFLSMTLLAFSFPEKARLMPLMIGIPGTILGLVQLITDIRTAMAEASIEADTEAVQKMREGRTNEIQMIIWTLVFFIGILCFGFVYASPLLVFGFLYIAKRETLLTGIISGICTFIVIYGVFEIWFAIPLFDGLILEWING